MSTQPTRGLGPATAAQALSLEYPMSLGVHDTYASAQKAVDYLSDHEFAVENVLIVGTDLKQLERVSGRLTRGRVAIGGLVSGAWLGLFVGTIFALLGSGTGFAGVVMTVLFGALFGVVWSLIGFQITRGPRDFTSVTQVVATQYEVLVEHKLAQQARELLATMDPMAAAQAQVQAARDAEAQAAREGQAQSQRTTPPASPPPPPSTPGA